MSKNLTFTEMHEIEQLLYFKANTILTEAQNYLGRFNYDLAVHRSQEAFELFLKSLFRFLQAQYPPSHDLKKQIYDLTAAFQTASGRPEPDWGPADRPTGARELDARSLALTCVLWR